MGITLCHEHNRQDLFLFSETDDVFPESMWNIFVRRARQWCCRVIGKRTYRCNIRDIAKNKQIKGYRFLGDQNW